jgi:hypothetical protein
MPEASKPERPNVVRLLFQLKQKEELNHQAVPGKRLDPKLALLREWQSNRLAGTYADLLANPAFEPACRFFLSDIYAARDFSQRDSDFERLHEVLSRYLPAQMLKLLHDAIELNRLSYRLDQLLLETMIDRLDLTGGISPQLYAEAYRLCNNYEQRVHQIEQMAQILREVSLGARLPLVGVSLRVLARPARAAGWWELYDFLERGITAFKPMRDSETFVNAIATRERLILDRIYTGEADPFTIK